MVYTCVEAPYTVVALWLEASDLYTVCGASFDTQEGGGKGFSCQYFEGRSFRASSVGSLYMCLKLEGAFDSIGRYGVCVLV